MKLNVKLTADELMDVVDAAVDAARERDYMILEEELIEDMTYIVDAALSAMGIEIVPADEDDADEEEEEVDDFGVPTDYWSEFDEEEPEPVHDPIAKMLFTYDGKVTISQKDAMEIVRQMTEMIEEQGKGLTGEQKTKWLRDALTALAEDYGIEYVLDI